MPLRSLGLAPVLCLALLPEARAGDTVTDNLPGGAVQIPGAGATASQMNAALPPPMIAAGPQPPPTASGTGQSPPSAIGVTPGTFSMRSTQGRSFSTASPFIGRVLTVYTAR
jgi:hypothetical protein